MGERAVDITEVLADTGCSQELIDRAESLLKSGYTEDLIRCLKLCRCDLMDELHEQYKKIDYLDHVIRQTEKTK
ncbi:MAG: hypothetical protein IIZ57_02915 [Solobacterium sp.]|nr:hypothetical protein [Solobacterium sp.]